MTAPQVSVAPCKCVPTATGGTSVTPSALDYTNSSYVQMIASTAGPITILGVALVAGTSNVWFEVDIAKGAALSETVVATAGGKIGFTLSSSSWFYYPFVVPVENIPISTRVAVRFRKEGTDVGAWYFKLVYYDSISNEIGVTAAAPLVTPDTTSPLVFAHSGQAAWANAAWQEAHAGLTDVVVLGAEVKDTEDNVEIEVDVGTGTAGNEVVVATIPVRSETRTGIVSRFPVGYPIRVTGTNRFSLRARGSVADQNVAARLIYASASDFGLSAMQTTAAVQVTTSDAANPPTVAGSGSAWTNSAWLEMVASTPAAAVITGIWLNPAAAGARGYEIDIGVGAGGAEVVVGTIADTLQSLAGVNHYRPLPVPLDAVPNASRISVRFRQDSTSATAWAFGVTYLVKPL